MAKKKQRRNEKGKGSFRYRDNGKVEYRLTYKDELGGFSPEVIYG